MGNSFGTQADIIRPRSRAKKWSDPFLDNSINFVFGLHRQNCYCFATYLR